MPFIHSIRTGVPEYVYNQIEFFEKVAPYTNPRLHNIFQRILEGSQIKKRHFSFRVEDMIKMTNEKRIEDKFLLWKNTSLRFFKKQISTILNDYSIDPSMIDGICTATTSGIVTPALDILLQDHFGFRRDMMRMPLAGYGCSGGMAAINKVDDYLKVYPHKAILVCAGETLSTQYEPGITVSNIVSNSIFSDGYGTLLMVGDEHPLKKDSIVEISNTGSYLFPNSNFAIGQWMTDEGLHTHVDAKIPRIINESLLTPMSSLFASTDLEISDINYWVLHQGGPKIMEAFSETLEINSLAVEPNLETFRQFGNQSSASVLTALERRMVIEQKAGHAFMMGLGPGVHCEYCLCYMTPSNSHSESEVCQDLKPRTTKSEQTRRQSSRV